MNKKLISVTGPARCGKNSLCNSLESEIKKMFPPLKIGHFSFAHALRQELDQFLIERFSISAFTENPTDKEIIRHMLIGYGNAKRQQTDGKYWIEKLENSIEKSDCDVAIISDLRFAETKDDELGWLINNGGINFHIRRFVQKAGQNAKRSFERPKNEWEKKNNPKLQKNATLVLDIERKVEDKDFSRLIQKSAQKCAEENLGFFL